MKKLPAGLLAAAWVLSLAACGGMMDRGGWGGDSSSRGSGSATGSSAYPDEGETRGSFPQSPD